jgi:hypothetical protein
LKQNEKIVNITLIAKLPGPWPCTKCPISRVAKMHVLKIRKVWNYSLNLSTMPIFWTWDNTSQKKKKHVHFSFFAFTLTPKAKSWTCNNVSPKSQWKWRVFIFVIRLFTFYTYILCLNFTPFWKPYYFQSQTQNLLLSISKLTLCTSCLSPWKWCNLWLFLSSHKVIFCLLSYFLDLQWRKSKQSMTTTTIHFNLYTLILLREGMFWACDCKSPKNWWILGLFFLLPRFNPLHKCHLLYENPLKETLYTMSKLKGEI